MTKVYYLVDPTTGKHYSYTYRLKANAEKNARRLRKKGRRVEVKVRT